MARFALKARYVFPVERPPVADAWVTIEAGRIERIGPERPDCPVHDLGDQALLPGLVNAHTHLEFSLLERPFGPRGLPDWIRQVIAWRRDEQTKLSEVDRQRALERGAAESVCRGTTSLGEIATMEPSVYTGAAGRLDMTLLFEVIAPRPALQAAALARISRQLERAARCPGVQAGISPHAPYTVCPSVVKRLVGLAVRRRLPVAMHLAESPEELRFLRSGDGPIHALLAERDAWDAGAIARGTRPLDYLKLLAPVGRVLVVHGNYLDDDELAFLAAHRRSMTLVYCPRTHAFFGHATYPLAKALQLGVSVALGTDSRASNPDLSLWDELCHIAAHHAPVAPRDLLRLGTLAGAEALGLQARVGSLAPGKYANLVAVQLPATIAGDPHAALFRHSAQVTATWYRGRRVADP